MYLYRIFFKDRTDNTYLCIVSLYLKFLKYLFWSVNFY